MYFPLHLNVSEAKIVIFGAGDIAVAKAESILEFVQAKQITIIAKDTDSQHQNIISELKIKFIKQEYDKEQLLNFDIVIAATNSKQINRQIASEARKLKKLVNIVDDPQYSDFIFGANIKKSGITISMSTSGIAPVLARLLKQKILKILPNNLDLISDFLQENKEKIRKKLTNIQARRLFYQDFLDKEIVGEIQNFNLSKAQQTLDNLLENSDNQSRSAVYFISAGPGDEELITLKAIKLLSKADVVLYDRLVAPEILEYARKDALKINVGKKRDFHKFSQDEINQMIRKYALEGKIVARLKGGDSAFFSRISEEVLAIKDLNIPYQIVAGVTAASGAAASLGIGLTSRKNNKSVRFLTLYNDDLNDDEYFKQIAKTDDSLVLYMSSHNLTKITEKLLKNGFKKDVELLVVEQATTKFQKVYQSTISQAKTDFSDKKFISPSLVIIGDIVADYQQNKWREENFEGIFFDQFTDINLQKKEVRNG